LSPVELELLTAWADGDTPLGAAEAPGAFTGIAVAAPDLIVDFPAAAQDANRPGTFEARAPTSASRWISGWALRAGDASTVERVTISIAGAGQLGSWVPGDQAVQFPTGVGQKLPAGARVSMEVRYRKSATGGLPPAALELWLRPDAERTVRHRLLGCNMSSVGENIDVLSLRPIAASAGDPLEIVARLPGGGIEPLVVIPQFDPGYPVTYRFRRPVALARGTTISVAGTSPGCGAEMEFSARGSGRARAPRP
jgi:hypothetical protein